MAQRPGSFINNAVDMQPLNPALLSEEQLAPELEAIQEEFEIEIDDDDVTEDDFGDLEVVEKAFSDNLAEAIAMEEEGESILEDLASELIELYESDVESRSDWEQISKEGVELLGLKIETMDQPFAGACGAHHPLLAQSVVKFQAKAYRELFPTGGPVRTRIMGAQTPEREDQAKRVREFMNFQTTIQMPEYGPQLDRLLFYTGLYGSGFKKTYQDPVLGRPASRFVRANDFVINYYATDLETCERYTHKMTLSHNDIRRYEIAGIYRPLDYKDPEQIEISEDVQINDESHGASQPEHSPTDPFVFLEMHVNINLDGYENEEGLQLPYIVTINEDEQKIVSIRRNWKEEDKSFTKRVWFTHYCLIPGLGFYGYGYIHLIGGMAKTATSTMRQLVDAGTFANMPGGFKAAGLRLLAPDAPMEPGEWREMNAPAGDIAKSLLPLPYKEPSPTLLKLLEFMVGTAKEFADNTEQVIADSTNYGPVGTTLALLEQSAKLFSAIHSRLHAAQAKDIRLLAELNYEFLPPQYPYQIAGGANQVFKDDFDLNSIDVVPVSDPNMPTESHRVAKLNAIMTLAGQDPAAHNMNSIRLDLYRAMGVESPERYMAQQQKPFVGDPVAENAAAMKGIPVHSTPTQHHDAHIAVHAMPLDNPAYAENQQMRQILMAHINEHLALKYQGEMMQMISQTDPEAAKALASGEQLPPEIEAAVSLAAANASDSILGLDKAKAQALIGEAEEDPIVEIQQEINRIREKDVDLKNTLERDKLKLKEIEVVIDDTNEDLDRAASIKKAQIQADSWNNQGD
tara:strand:+ start:14024 stop:16423 length:2400 start_codon:yes stop_codon:yes gene_type:complete